MSQYLCIQKLQGTSTNVPEHRVDSFLRNGLRHLAIVLAIGGLIISVHPSHCGTSHFLHLGALLSSLHMRIEDMGHHNCFYSRSCHFPQLPVRQDRPYRCLQAAEQIPEILKSKQASFTAPECHHTEARCVIFWSCCSLYEICLMAWPEGMREPERQVRQNTSGSYMTMLSLIGD